MTTATERLAELATGAPARKPNVRALAQFAANASCRTASLAFAARVNLDLVLEGTPLEAPFGQSPFAFRRGNTFEDRLRLNGHAPILGLLRDTLRCDVSKAKVANMRGTPPFSQQQMQERADRTRALIARIVACDPSAANLIDGAVLSRNIGGIPAYFEADAVAAYFQSDGVAGRSDPTIHAGEIKSFPTVDGQADPEKVGAAVAQVSIYLLLLRDLVAELGGKPELVSDQALLITPRNTGLQPTMTVKIVRLEIDRAERILRAAPSAVQIAESVPRKVRGFGAIADKKVPTTQRLEAAHGLVECVGNAYTPACLAACGFSRLCRERADKFGDPARVGPQLTRLLPGIGSLDRVSELANGARPREDEEPVSEQLVRAEGLFERFSKPARGVRGATGKGVQR